MCTPSAGYQGALPTVLGGGRQATPLLRFTFQDWAYSTCLLAISIYRFLLISLLGHLFLLIWRQFINETSPLIGYANLSFVLTFLQVFLFFFFPHTGDLYVAGFLNLCFHVYEYGVVFFKTPKSVKIN